MHMQKIHRIHVANRKNVYILVCYMFECEMIKSFTIKPIQNLEVYQILIYQVSKIINKILLT